jgi:hypothetical protein
LIRPFIEASFLYRANISTNNSDRLGSNNYTCISTDIATSESDTEAEETERGEEKRWINEYIINLCLILLRGRKMLHTIVKSRTYQSKME